jgi:4-amino-4-deoxy-L-arabinose transferase-like glycosyltransferase
MTSFDSPGAAQGKTLSRSIANVPAWVWAWAVLCGAMLIVRPALPIDETRYLAVAWEMWWRKSFAVPYLNGEFYAAKPPLFFWLMHLGWWFLGVNDWGPRFVAPLFGLGQLLLVRATAIRLWGDRDVAGAAPWLLFGSLLWAVFCASTMFDMLLGFCATLSVYAIVRVWRDGNARYFALAGLALGFGVLAKGPVAFLPALFIVSFAPWWMREPGAAPLRWGTWTRGALGATAIAALVTLAWLIPMAMASDVDYLANITLHQTVGYTVRSFSHARPFWWYVPLLPLLLFPWILWPRAWRAAGAIRGVWADSGVRLCVVWIVAVFTAFSAFSGKQAHYLLLFFPAVALLLARLLPRVERAGDVSIWLPASVHAAGGLLLLALARGLIPAPGVPWLSQASGLPLEVAGAAWVGLGIAVASVRKADLGLRIRVLAATTGAMTLVLAWGLMRASQGAYDVRPMSAYLAGLEARGAPLAAITRYDGEYNFYGRLRSRVEVLDTHPERWARAHPDGYLFVRYHSANWRTAGIPAPAREESYRGATMVVWRAADVAADPGIARTFE